MLHRLPWFVACLVLLWSAAGAHAAEMPDLLRELREAVTGETSDAEDAGETATPRVAVISLHGAYGDQPDHRQEMMLPGFGGGASFYALAHRLHRTAQDDRVQGVLLRMDAPELMLSASQVYELGRLIDHVRKSGKRVDAYLENASQQQFKLACHCDNIAMAPSGTLLLTGVSLSAFYLKDLLDLLGVRFDAVRVGQYKGAAEPLVKNEMTEQTREVLNGIADQFYAQLVDAMTGRGLKEDQARDLIDNGPYHARAAQEAGLIDALTDYEKLGGHLAQLHEKQRVELVYEYGKRRDGPPMKRNFSIFEFSQAFSELLDPPSARPPRRDHIALLYATGPIFDGYAPISLFGDSGGIYSLSFEQVVLDLMNNDHVKAVVMRVNSPGGSASASDRIARRLRDLAEKKPLIVSMGEVAASGGYYISAPADKIFAAPETLTGSIGVVGGKLVIGDALKKLGVNVYAIERGKQASLWSPSRGFTKTQRAAVQRLLDAVYDDFVLAVSLGRNMMPEEVRAVAEGRVWTGEQAIEKGLVDQAGSLRDALLEAKKRIGLDLDQKILVAEYPRPMTLLQLLSADAPAAPAPRAAAVEHAARALLPRSVLRRVRSLRRLLVPGRLQILAVSPVLIDVR